MTPEEQEQEREDVRRRTEENHKKIPETVLKLLAERNVTLDHILKMNRQEFEALDNWVYEQKIPREDRRALIHFKHASMTSRELTAYSKLTEAEYDELEKDPDYEPLPDDFVLRARPMEFKKPR